jgi:SAM-dependent methyltransferase
VDDSYDPLLYDLFNPPDTDDSDIQLYRKLARETGGPVLELGAGTGRTLLPVARDGHEVHGLDTSERMLDALRTRLAAEPAAVQERVHVRTGDMRAFEIPTSFALIQIPLRGFLHAVTRDEQIATLHNCARQLLPGGVLAFSVFHPSLEMQGPEPATQGLWRFAGERAHPDGGRVVASEVRHYDTEAQRLSLRLKYERFDATGLLVSSHYHPQSLAYLYPTDLRELLPEAGFDQVEITGGFDGAPIADDGQELIVRARRP